MGLIGTPVDGKNIGLAKVLYGLRQDSDVYCLISVNAASIKERGGGVFFGHIQMRAIESIVLCICKIFEDEKQYELESIRGVIRYLMTQPASCLDESKVKEFLLNYGCVSSADSLAGKLQNTVEVFRTKYKDELERFKTFRDKKAAHSEYGVIIDSLPSYDVMEKLFLFGADFYKLVSAAFVGVGPDNLETNRPVKVNLKNLLERLGLQSIQTDMK
ncbi:MAG TPA: hypothetical protein VLD60_11410 [Nitrospira sp.]|nr:hypothetical protein [Nitrospira sp.]